MPRRPLPPVDALLLVLLALLVVLALGAPPRGARAASAEPEPAAERSATPQPGIASRGAMLVVLRIADALRLSDEQTVKLAREFRAFAAQRKALLAEKTDLASRLQTELAKQSPDEATLGTLTERIVAIDRDLARLPERLWTSIQPLLTVEQRARLVLLRGKLKQQVEGERRRRSRSGGRAGARPGRSPRTAD